ncbi:MAG: hypothetical protein ACMUIG_08595 [Thermoplasmatota archaeon]
MWFITFLTAAVISTLVWYASDRARNTYGIGILNLILWGTTILVFVDHVVGYLSEGGEFFEVSTDAFLLSVVLLSTAFLVWEGILFIKDPKGLLGKARDRT